MPRERTQQLKEEQAVENGTDTAEEQELTGAEKTRQHREAGLSSSNSTTETTETDSSKSSNYHANTKSGSNYHGDGYGFRSSYDGQTYHNGSFGRDMIISDALITDSDYDYINVASMGEIVNDYNKDYFTTEGKTISEALNQLDLIHKGLVESGYFYGKHPEGEAPLAGDGGIIDLMQQFQTAKTQMDPSLIEEATGLYNDDLEKAKNLKYKEYLESKCDEYNNNPKVLGLYLDYSQKNYSEQIDSEGNSTWVEDGYNYVGQEFNDYGYFDSKCWNSNTPRYENIPDTATIGSEYVVNDGNGMVRVSDTLKDYIEYNFLFKEYNGIIDTLFNDVASLEEKLEPRKNEGLIDYKKLDPRPDYSYYNG